MPKNLEILHATSSSAEFKWKRSDGPQEQLSGFLLRVYELSEDGRRLREEVASNCSVSLINDENTCKLDDLKPSTNYSATITAFKFPPKGSRMLGDESQEIRFRTGEKHVKVFH